MKRILIAVLVLLTIISAHSLAEVRVERTQGVVEYRLPQSPGWETLMVGQNLPQGTTIISGFNGTAVLLSGNSTIEIEPLSRVVLSTTQISDVRENTELNMRYGQVRSQVRRAQNRGTDFSVSSPVSTAAVRGTEFVFSGRELSVFEGDVAFSNLAGQQHSVRAGQTSRTWKHLDIESVEAVMLRDLRF
ncbi:MAG: hypothetical protein EA428_05690 [Spirochaetaceae bacterium]|nr:MAG: hypothetical protein EA428_05690 [Spirochaetaceae bacterium]